MGTGGLLRQLSKRWISGLYIWVAILYFDTLTHEFSYDDFQVVVKNTAIRDLRNMGALFSPQSYFPVSGEMSYRPMVTFFYLFESALFGVKPVGFHATSVFLHGTCGVLLAWILMRLGMENFCSVWAAALFLAHPAATEAVNGIGFLEDVLALFFMLLSLAIGLARTDGRAWQIAVASLSYFLALLSKEVAILFPVIGGLILKKAGWDSRALRHLAGGMGAVMVLYGCLRFIVFLPPEGKALASSTLSMSETALTMATVAANYIRLFLVPIGLSASHVVVVEEKLRWESGLALIGLGCAAWLVIKSSISAIRLGGLWCLLFLLPVSQIVATAQLSAERFLYAPLAGVAIAAAGAVSLARTPLWSRGIPCTVLAVLALLAVDRNKVWRTHDSLFEDAVVQTPRNPFAIYSLGVSAADRREHGLAELYFRTALEIKPDYDACSAHLASVLYDAGRYPEAIELLTNLLDRKPWDGNARMRIAWSYARLGDTETARRHLERARSGARLTPAERAALRELEENL